MSKVGDSSGAQGVSYDQFLRSLEGTATVDKTGQGLTGVQNGNVPPPPTGGATSSLAASLNAFNPIGDGSKVDTSVLLVQVAVSMRDAEATSQKSKIDTDMETKKNQAKEKEGKLQEAQKKMEEAEEKKKSGSLIDKIKLAFEWIGAILAVATAAVLIATGVATAVGIALIVAATAAVIMAIDSTVAMANDGMGIAGSARYADLKAQGKSDKEAREDANKADMGFRIAMAVVGIGASIVAGGASMTSSARAIASAVSDTAKVARVALSITEASANIAAAGVDAGRTAVTYQEKELRSEVKGLESDAKNNEAFLQLLDKAIDEALSILMAAGDRFAAILDNIMDAVQDRGHTLSKAQFRG